MDDVTAATAGPAVGASSSPDIWATRLDVAALLIDYLAALDERRFDDAASCFTDDGVLQFGEVRITGVQAIGAAMRRDLGVLDLTHHTISNTKVVLTPSDGDATGARLSAQAIGTHLWTEDGARKQALMGGRYEATMVRTGLGWRLQHLAPSFLWTIGDPWEH